MFVKTVESSNEKRVAEIEVELRRLGALDLARELEYIKERPFEAYLARQGFSEAA